MIHFPLQQLLPELLSAIPEIEGKYKAMEVEAARGYALWDEQDFADMEIIKELHGFPDDDDAKPGMTIVLEELVVPFTIAICQDTNRIHRLTGIMALIETWASSSIFDIRNLVAVCFCEPLLISHEDYLITVFPYMGVETKKICRMQLKSSRNSSEIMKLFEADL